VHARVCATGLSIPCPFPQGMTPSFVIKSSPSSSNHCLSSSRHLSSNSSLSSSHEVTTCRVINCHQAEGTSQRSLLPHSRSLHFIPPCKLRNSAGSSTPDFVRNAVIVQSSFRRGRGCGGGSVMRGPRRGASKPQSVACTIFSLLQMIDLTIASTMGLSLRLSSAWIGDCSEGPNLSI
jgi:hypothetical protein